MRPVRGLMGLFALTGLLVQSACISSTPYGPTHDAQGGPDCRATYVVDGDTVHLACDGVGEFKARLLGIDTPEVYSPECPEELAAGNRATDILSDILQSGPVTGVGFGGQDRYGRELVRLEVAGIDVAEAMIQTGYAVPYSGGRSPDWCSFL